MQIADSSAKRSRIDTVASATRRREALLALTSVLALSVSSICAGSASAQTAGSGAAPGSAAGATLPEVTVEPPKVKAKPKAVATKPAKAPTSTTAKKPKVAAKKKPAPVPAPQPAPAPAAEPEFGQAPSAPASSEATGIGPLTQGADVTIGSTTLSTQQPSTVQGLFAGQTTVSAGGTTQSSTKVYVHGVEETMLNVQIDGARQPQRGAFHHNGNNLIDPAMLKGVAIDAGASPADAGPNALGGGIRYTTKDATDFLKPGQIMGGFGKLSYDTNAQTFTKSGAAYAAKNGFEILGYALHGDGDAYEDGRDNTVVATDVDLLNFLGKVAYEARSGDRFAFSGEYIRDQGLRPFRANLAISSVGPINPAYSYNEAERQTYTFKYTNTKPTYNYDPEISFYYNKNTTDRPSPRSPCNFFFGCTAFGEVEMESIGGKAQNTFRFGGGALTVGTDFYRDEVTTTRLGIDPIPAPGPPGNFLPAMDGVFGEKVTNVGAYAQYRLDVSKPFRISTGVRVDYNKFDAKDGQDFDNTGVSPNVSLEYDVTSWLTAKGSYGYSFGGIPPYEAFLYRPTNPVYSPALDAQWGQTYKLGLQIKRDGFLAEASYFNTQILDPVCPSCTNGDDGPVVNLADIEIKGVDLSASYSWRNAQLTANFTHTESDFGNGPLTPTSYYFGTPFGDILKFSGFYEFEGTGVMIGFLSQFAFEYDDLENVPVQGTTFGPLKAYNVHNVYLQWIPNFAPNVTLRADVLNIFDEYYIDRATAVGGVSTPLASVGRTFLLSGKVEF